MTNLDYIVEGCPACSNRDPFMCSEQVHEGTKPCRCDCHGLERPECCLCDEDAAHVAKNIAYVRHGVVSQGTFLLCQKHMDLWNNYDDGDE